MKNYVGIDLGTTNSAICSYDGESIHIYKSPEQNDVTPSAIFIDKRGHKYVGTSAYNNAPRNPDNAATLFKRLMGTTTPIKLKAVNLTMTPAECSAEVLRTLFGYLPESIRNDADIGTVITVPAAFNQMQKDATMEAAKTAGIGNVSLMQEPVAAVMSVMRKRKGDGIFLVYDLGGGTLDIAIAQSIGGRVSLLGQGGIAMCGGRDFDRRLLDNIVTPWLAEHFNLPADFSVDPNYRSLIRMAVWAAEKAKIQLSAKEETVIAAGETELGIRDLDGSEIYLDIPVTRVDLDLLIAEDLANSVKAARETIEKVGLSAHDIERIVFVGGPTQYASLREKVSFELGISPSIEVNPMTAVAEGAAVFAESIDWSTLDHGRKSARGAISAGGSLDISFNFIARTPEAKSKIGLRLGGKVLSGAAFQIDSLDTGWSSGRIDLKDGALVDVSLSKTGDNTFKLFVFDSTGGPISLKEDKITITRTAATVDAIPASHSIGMEVRDKVGGNSILDYLVREGDPLPKKGQLVYKAEESLRAGSPESLKFKLWEGEISYPIEDNRYIGVFEIKGSDFDDGVIAAGAELVCDFSILDSGNIVLEVSVPSIAGSFPAHQNFYSWKDAGVDYSRAGKLIVQDAQKTLDRLREIENQIDDPALNEARERLTRASKIDEGDENPENAKKAMDEVQHAKKNMANARKNNLRPIRQMELNKLISTFNEAIRQYARPSEETAFENLVKSAQRQIDQSGSSNEKQEFEGLLGQLKSKIFMILWRQDWFVVDKFKWYLESPHLFPNDDQHADLVKRGQIALSAGNADELRKVVAELDMHQISSPDADDFMARTNIVRG
jgi:molecular chaperone DnaK